MSFLDKHNVLVLNSLWQVIGTVTPKQAIVSLNSSIDGISTAAKAINISYKINEDGSPNLNEAEEIRDLNFEEWLQVPIRKGLDEVIHSAKLSIRCPTVIVTTNYSKMPMRKHRASKSVLYELQKGICGLTNKKISMKQANLEHKIPKSHGGKETFENLMVVDKEINSKRGNKPYEQLGLKPLFHHREPKPIPASYTIKEIKHPDWKFFFYK